MSSEDSQSGVSVLRLLAEKSTVAIMRELASGPLRPSEIKRRLPSVTHSALMRRLAELVERGAVTRERVVGLSPRAYYSLTYAGRALLEIPDAAARWGQQRTENQAASPRATRPGFSGATSCCGWPSVHGGP
jgi:DNA-binding HxlR family transcriptional regulator